MKDIISVDPFTFEAVVAAFFHEIKKTVYLTPEQNDKGVDVIVMPDNLKNTGLLIQVKHASDGRKVGSDVRKLLFQRIEKL